MSNKRPRKRSLVWEHFEQTPDGERAICKHCGSSLSGKSTGGTTHLKRHIETCSKQRDPDPGNKVREFRITEDKSWEVEMKKVVLAEIPFAPSDCKKVYCSFNWFMEENLDKLMFTYYENEKEKLAIELKNLTSRVSITYNMVEVKYLAITAYFINNDFNFVKRLIGFKKITNVPSLKFLRSIMQSCISDWRLGDKTFMLIGGANSGSDVVRDGSSNVGFRSIQLCYQKFITSSYERIWTNLYFIGPNKIVYFFDGLCKSMSKVDGFNQISEEQGLPPFNESLFARKDFKTCNESFIRMIKHALLYKEVLRQYESRDANAKILSEINWERFKLILNYCELMHDVINDGLSSCKNPTLHLCIQYLLKIRDNISSTEIGSTKFQLEESARILHLICSLTLPPVACILDPRCKLYPFEYIEQINQIKETKGLRKKIYTELQKLFGEFAEQETNRASPSHIGTTGTTITQDEGSYINSSPGHTQNLSSFSVYMSQKLKMKPSGPELDQYLNENVVVPADGSFDLLAWWKGNKSRYPVLSRMARDILAVPASVYKVSELITSDLRRLEGVDPQLVEAVVCSKDWIISSSQREPKI